MSSFITYNHPSLVLGNIVDTRVLDCLQLIQACQARADSARDKMNYLIMMKNSVNMTINELKNLGINTSLATKKIEELDTEIMNAASDYLSANMKSQQDIVEYRNQLCNITTVNMAESPIDFGRSKLIAKPAFSDSLNFDSQFFSFAGGVSEDTIGNIEKFIRSSTNNISDKSNEITNKVSEQIGNQLKNQKLCGTLIIVASCTHRNIDTFSPLIIDPTKAVSAWNQIYPDEVIDISDIKIGDTTSQSDHKLNLITGAVYGSSFVGMVHMLRSEMSGFDNMESSKNQLDEKLRLGGWLEGMTGGFGVDAAMLKDVRSFLSTKSIDTHVSIVSMGVIPQISSSRVRSCIKTLSAVDEETKRDILAISSGESQTTTASEADKSKESARLLNIQNARLNTIVTSVGSIEQEENRILNLNSLMTSFDNYVESVKNANESVGVPISFFTRGISKPEIIRQYLNAESETHE